MNGKDRKARNAIAKRAVSIEDFGAVGDYNYSTKLGKDNTVAIQAAVNYASANGKRLIIPTGYYRITDTIHVPGNLTIEGNGALELFGSLSGGSNPMNFPTIAPYLSGSVLVMTGNNKDAISLDGVAPTVNLRDFGILFDTGYINTGHGITTNQPIASGTGKPDSGPFGCEWSNIKVYGHDGNHYAFNMTNPLYNTFINLRSYGGGMIRHLGDGGVNSGNTVFINPYGSVFLGGTAHGISLENPSNGTNKINLMTFVKPQIWIDSRNTLPGGVAVPTNAQRNINADLASLTNIGFISPDIETTVGSKAYYPYGSGCYFTPGLNPLGNDVGNGFVSGTTYQNKCGCGVLFNMAVTMNPTAGADATALVTVSTSATFASGNSTPARLTVPAGSTPGQVLMMPFPVWTGAYYKVDLVNASVNWTTNQKIIM